jgi:ankyrin repeat protein
MAEERCDDIKSGAIKATACPVDSDVPSVAVSTACDAAAAAFDPAMHNAARNGDVASIEALYSANKSAVNSVDKLQRTPLHMACWAGCVAAAEKLIHLGADVDAPASDAMTPLMFASQNNHAAIVQLLAKSGASLDAHDSKKKNCALHIAAAKSHADTVNTLLQCGASPNVRNKAGQTPGDTATDSKLKQLLPRSKAAMSRARAERKEAAALACDPSADADAPKRERLQSSNCSVKRPAVSFDEEE